MAKIEKNAEDLISEEVMVQLCREKSSWQLAVQWVRMKTKGSPAKIHSKCRDMKSEMVSKYNYVASIAKLHLLFE
jgi:hypothetical protein